jgi:ribokinase
VVVVGSINFDEVIAVAALPAPGETVFGEETASGLGGKGANQAVAAAAAGADVVLVGAVGGDERGVALLESLTDFGVDTSAVARLDGTATGRALVVLNAAGENEIIVLSGANQAVDERVLSRDALHGAEVMVLQGELAPKVNIAAARMAAELGLRAVVNLAPVQDLGDGLRHADPLVVNEVEAGQLIGADLASVRDVSDAAPQLRRLARSVVVTLGALGAVLITAEVVDHIPAPNLELVRDTTGAGDALVGVLAASLAQGLRLRDAVARAVQAASLSVTEIGAAASYATFRGGF